MKKLMALVFSIVCILGLASCSSESANKTSPIFSTQDISSIAFYEYPDYIEVPDEYLLEITDWLGTFTVGKEITDNVLVPGSNTTKVRIEYLDGTVIENGLSTIKIDDVMYYLNHEDAPDCYLKILE